MTEKREPNQYDPLMDTQRLLLGAEPLEDEDISLESILAEYGSGGSAGNEASTPLPAEDTAPAQAEEADSLTLLTTARHGFTSPSPLTPCRTDHHLEMKCRFTSISLWQTA